MEAIFTKSGDQVAAEVVDVNRIFKVNDMGDHRALCLTVEDENRCDVVFVKDTIDEIAHITNNAKSITYCVSCSTDRCIQPGETI